MTKQEIKTRILAIEKTIKRLEKILSETLKEIEELNKK